jgi:type IV secretory pathway VirB2 component (pilin)
MVPAHDGTPDAVDHTPSPMCGRPQEKPMASRTNRSDSLRYTTVFRLQQLAIWLALVIAPSAVFAQSPWERAALNLEATFTGTLARSLALVAIVIGGLMFMFGEGGAKRQISGIVFGGGLTLFAGQFLTWLF